MTSWCVRFPSLTSLTMSLVSRTTPQYLVFSPSFLSTDDRASPRPRTSAPSFAQSGVVAINWGTGKVVVGVEGASEDHVNPHAPVVFGSLYQLRKPWAPGWPHQGLLFPQVGLKLVEVFEEHTSPLGCKLPGIRPFPEEPPEKRLRIPIRASSLTVVKRQ